MTSETLPPLIARIEAALFVHGDPLSVTKLSAITGSSKDDVEAALTELSYALESDSESGLFLIREEGSVLLATKPSCSQTVQATKKSTLHDTLSKAALETLSVVVYRAPVTRADIDLIRGVNCTMSLRTLLLRGLIDREGNPEDGRGYLYRPSMELLKTLGISALEKLPDYETLSNDDRLKALLDTSASQGPSSHLT